MKRVLVLLLLVVSSLFAIATEAEYDYGKVRWGMTIQEVAKALGGYPDVGSQCIKRWIKYCGFDIQEEYYFTGSKLRMIYFSTKAPVFAFITNDFIKKYGSVYSLSNDGKYSEYRWKSTRTDAEAACSNSTDFCCITLKSLVPLVFEKTDSLF